MGVRIFAFRPVLMGWKQPEHFGLVTELEIVNVAVHSPAIARLAPRPGRTPFSYDGTPPVRVDCHHVLRSVHRLGMGITTAVSYEGGEGIRIEDVVIAKIHDEIPPHQALAKALV